MTKLAIAMSVLAVGMAIALPARADFAVVKFRDSGQCRAWSDSKTKPMTKYQVLWAKEPTWEAAQAKGAWAMKHHWCKGWH